MDLVWRGTPFVYQICDLGSPNECATAGVNVTVDAVNDAPIATEDTADTDEDTPITIDVLANDTDVDSTLLYANVSVTLPPIYGTAVVVGTGITYTPPAGYDGFETFVYQICDLGDPNECDTAGVNVTVDAVNDEH